MSICLGFHSIDDINIIYYSVESGGVFLRPVDVAAPLDTEISIAFTGEGLDITIYTDETVRQTSILLNEVVTTTSTFEMALTDVWQSAQGMPLTATSPLLFSCNLLCHGIHVVVVLTCSELNDDDNRGLRW